MYLVTGATGLVGSHIAMELIAAGHNVRATKRVGSIIPQWLAAYNTIEWVDADVLNIYALEEAMQGVSGVFHCAAAVQINKADTKTLHQVNVLGTANVVDAALLLKIPMLHISSIAALGHEPKTLIVEHTPFEYPATPYSVSKYLSEMEVERGIAEGLNAKVICPGVILGPHCIGTPSGKLIRMGQKGFKYHTNGSTGWVDVRDVAKAAVLLFFTTTSHHKYICVSENVNFQKVFTTINALYGHKPPGICVPKWLLRIISFIPFIPIDKSLVATATTHYRYDNSLIKKDLSIDFIPFETTIKDSQVA